MMWLGNKVYWLTGLSGSGKTTIGRLLANKLSMNNKRVSLLDGDALRKGLCKDLGFDCYGRTENIRRVAHAARLIWDSGAEVICCLITPLEEQRELARSIITSQTPSDIFKIIHINASLETCKQRDPKGLYARAARDKEFAEQMTGIGQRFEMPGFPDIVVDTETETPSEICDKILLV